MHFGLAHKDILLMDMRPKPPAICRSVGRRATRDGLLWVRVGLAEQPRRLIDATRDHGEAASGSRIFFFSFFLLACWEGGLCRSTHRSERGRRGRKYDRKILFWYA